LRSGHGSLECYQLSVEVLAQQIGFPRQHLMSRCVFGGKLILLRQRGNFVAGCIATSNYLLQPSSDGCRLVFLAWLQISP